MNYKHKVLFLIMFLYVFCIFEIAASQIITLTPLPISYTVTYGLNILCDKTGD